MSQANTMKPKDRKYSGLIMGGIGVYCIATAFSKICGFIQIARVIAFVALILCTILLFTNCTVEKTDITDYQHIYNGAVEDWNRAATYDAKRDSLLGFGEYLYNSELILFPRETPTTLTDFYFHWTQGMDVDGYAIYFTCTLSDDAYASFAQGLADFDITNETGTVKPLYDTEHFNYPAYILQWNHVGEKWEVLEYIMLDEQERTAIFVYTMSELEYIEEHSSYPVTPSDLYFLDEDFSIYEAFENSAYDISFLEYLR